MYRQRLLTQHESKIIENYLKVNLLLKKYWELFLKIKHFILHEGSIFFGETSASKRWLILNWMQKFSKVNIL